MGKMALRLVLLAAELTLSIPYLGYDFEQPMWKALRFAFTTAEIFKL